MRFTLRKAERLVSVTDIEKLFTSGSRSFSVFPVRAIFRSAETEEEHLKVMFSVSKRHFKHAVDRNRSKRQMREAFRMNRQILLQHLEKQNKHLHIAFIWMANRPCPSADIAKSIKTLLHLILEKYENAR